MPDDTANRIAHGLARIGVVMKQNAWKQGTDRQLTPTQAQVLTFLRTQSDAADVGLNHVAARLAVTPATASDAVSALVDKKLVRKRPGATDARTIALNLTAAGRKEADRALQWPDFVASAVDVLAPDEQAVLLRSIVKMIATLQQRQQIATARVCATCRYFKPNAHRSRKTPHHCAFIDAPFGDTDLQTDCPDHESPAAADAAQIYQLFVNGSPATR